MKPRPKHYRQRIYDYVEGMLGRPLSLDEHDDLRDIISEYAFSITNLRAQFPPLVLPPRMESRQEDRRRREDHFPREVHEVRQAHAAEDARAFDAGRVEGNAG